MAQAQSQPFARMLEVQSASAQMGTLLMEHFQPNSIEALLVVLIPSPSSIRPSHL